MLERNRRRARHPASKIFPLAVDAVYFAVKSANDALLPA